MVINVFTKGVSKANPGDAGSGIIIYDNKEIIFKSSDYLGKKTQFEAEYLTFIKAIKKINELNISTVNFFADSEILIKQLKGEYSIKAENVKKLYDKVKSEIKNLKINYMLIREEDNATAYDLATQAIRVNKTVQKAANIKINKNKLILDKAFFGKINCLKIQMNSNYEVYFHMGLTKKNSKEWEWKKVKMSDSELGELIHLLRQKTGKCSFFHSFENSKTQIWCNKNETSFSIKIDTISKNLNIGEYEVLRMILENCIINRNFN